MLTTFRPCDSDQMKLMPPALQDCLSDRHPAHYARTIVDQSPLYARYAGDGRRNSRYDPGLLLTILIYANRVGIYSSRKIAAKLETDVAFLMLAARNRPGHRTVCRFREQHLELLEAYFVCVVQIARSMRFVKFGKLAIDGTKVWASASKRKAMSYGRMLREEERSEKEIRAMLRKATAVHAEEHVAEDRTRGAQRNPKGAPDYKHPFGIPDTKAQENFTDPDSRIKKTSQDGFHQCCKVQMVIDAEPPFIVAANVINIAGDRGPLEPTLDVVQYHYGLQPAAAITDAGYCKEADVRKLERRQMEGFIPAGKENQKTSKDVDRKRLPAMKRMQDKLRTDAGKRAYRDGKGISEAPNSWIKHVLGFRRFGLPGLEKVRREWDLVCLGLNIKRLHAQLVAEALLKTSCTGV